jgi:acetyl esterase/lipase
MGFSAGGEVAAMVAFGEGQGDNSAPDPIDRENGKPNFQILVFQGPLYIPDAISSADPPGFIVAAFDDPCCSTPSIKLLQVYHQAGVPMEAHVYAKGGHAFNMGYRSDLETISSWPDRLTDWFKDNGWIGD